MSLSIWITTGGRNISQYTQWSRPKLEHFATSAKSCTKAMEVATVIRKEAARNIWIFFLGFKRTNVGNLSGSLDSSQRQTNIVQAFLDIQVWLNREQEDIKS